MPRFMIVIWQEQASPQHVNKQTWSLCEELFDVQLGLVKTVRNTDWCVCPARMKYEVGLVLSLNHHRKMIDNSYKMVESTANLKWFTFHGVFSVSALSNSATGCWCAVCCPMLLYHISNCETPWGIFAECYCDNLIVSLFLSLLTAFLPASWPSNQLHPLEQ